MVFLVPALVALVSDVAVIYLHHMGKVIQHQHSHQQQQYHSMYDSSVAAAASSRNVTTTTSTLPTIGQSYQQDDDLLLMYNIGVHSSDPNEKSEGTTRRGERGNEPKTEKMAGLYTHTFTHTHNQKKNRVARFFVWKNVFFLSSK